MYWQYTPYVWIYAVAALLGCGMAWYAMRHRDIPGAMPFAILQLSAALWSVANVFEGSRTDLPTILFFSNLAFIGISPIAPATLGIALQYTGKNLWLTRKKLIWLALIPAITILLSWTNTWHGLIRQNVTLKIAGRLTVLSSTPGPWYWVHTAYAYVLAFVSLWVLAAALRHCARPLRRQLFVLIAALLIILGGNIARHVGLLPLPSHISSTFFVPGGAVFMLGLFRFKLFDIAPVARDIIFENLTDSVIVLDAKNRIVDMNPSARKLFGRRTHNAVGQSGRVLFGSRPELIDLYRDVIEKRDEITIENGGAKYSFDLRISPLHDRRGRLTGRLIVLSDITSRKKVEEELREAKLTAESATRAKSEFLAMMSHEIRTPMNAVLGIADLMLATETDPVRCDLMQTIHQSGESLLTIINDVLDFTKIESGKMELESRPFDIRQCVEQSLDLLSSKAAEKGLGLSCIVSDNTPAVIMGDVTRLKQILVNLVGNALKFTECGEIVVKVSSRKAQPQNAQPQDPQPKDDLWEIQFAVRDTGIGIPHDRLDRLFQLFSQVDTSTTRKYGGTGLGLAICKRLSELMGGTIWVESEGVPGKGSTFYFTIASGSHTVEEPTAPNAQTPADASSSKPKVDDKMAERLPLRILLAEDNPINQKVAQHTLARLGYRADIAGNGLEVLEACSNRTYDVVLMDMHMPEMDGVEATRLLRHRFPADQMPVIVAVTADAMQGDRERFLERGMDYYISKPLRIEDLIHVLLQCRTLPSAKEIGSWAATAQSGTRVERE